MKQRELCEGAPIKKEMKDALNKMENNATTSNYVFEMFRHENPILLKKVF